MLTELKYTICFCHCDGKILMLYRVKKPNQYVWNGLGGKIETGETPYVSIQREMLEEAHIDIAKAQDVFYTGIVTWNKNDDKSIRGGMYAFIVEIPKLWIQEKETAEGLLAWKELSWIYDLSHKSVVSNIPHFLPHMLEKKTPKEYRLFYQGNELQHMEILNL